MVDATGRTKHNICRSRPPHIRIEEQAYTSPHSSARSIHLLPLSHHLIRDWRRDALHDIQYLHLIIVVINLHCWSRRRRTRNRRRHTRGRPRPLAASRSTLLGSLTSTACSRPGNPARASGRSRGSSSARGYRFPRRSRRACCSRCCGTRCLSSRLRIGYTMSRRNNTPFRTSGHFQHYLPWVRRI